MHIVTKGIVLRETNYKESDKILTILTEELGKCTVKARGCRKRGSALAASAQLLTYSDMTLVEYRDRLTLTEGSSVALFPKIRSDLERLALGSYFAQVVEATAQEGERETELLSLLLNCLYALDQTNYPLTQIKAAFEFRLLTLSGYEPQLDCCALCGEQQPKDPCFHLREGLLYCSHCRESIGETGTVSLSQAVLSSIRYICRSPRRFLSFQVNEESLKLLGETAEAFLLTQLERSFSTLDFWKSVYDPGNTGKKF